MPEIKIFLASSSELTDDRKEFEILINRKNKELRERNIFLRLEIWEDFFDAMSASGLQSEYNKVVKDSDIFVMLAQNKVGQYTTEEFSNAFGQFIETDKPFIFIYLKPSTTRDRADLQSRWAFEDKLKELKHYSTNYSNVEGLREHFGNQINKLIAKEFNDAVSETQSSQSKGFSAKHKAPLQMPSLPGAIFISYRRTDSIAETGRIYDRLVSEFGRENVFKDMDSIPLGVDFAMYLSNEVSKCQIMLVIIGKTWLAAADSEGARRIDNPNDFVRVEIEAALSRGISVIPILVDTTSMPKYDQLPESLRLLTGRNGMSVGYDPRFHTDMNRLIKGLRELLRATRAAESISDELTKAKRLKGTLISTLPQRDLPTVKPAEEKRLLKKRAEVKKAFTFRILEPKTQQEAQKQTANSQTELILPSQSHLSPTIVEFWISNLNNSDSKLRRKTIWELGQRGIIETVKPLSEMLEKVEDKEKVLIIFAIREILIRRLRSIGELVKQGVTEETKPALQDYIVKVRSALELVVRELNLSEIPQKKELHQELIDDITMLNNLLDIVAIDTEALFEAEKSDAPNGQKQDTE